MKNRLFFLVLSMFCTFFINQSFSKEKDSQEKDSKTSKESKNDNDKSWFDRFCDTTADNASTNSDYGKDISDR